MAKATKKLLPLPTPPPPPRFVEVTLTLDHLEVDTLCALLGGSAGVPQIGGIITAMRKCGAYLELEDRSTRYNKDGFMELYRL